MARNTKTQKTAVNVLTFTTDAASALAVENPALAAGIGHNAKAVIESTSAANVNDVLVAVDAAEAVKAEAVNEAVNEAAETAALAAAALESADDAISGLNGAEIGFQFVRKDFLRQIGESLNAYAQVLRIGVVTREGWFDLRANVLPAEIASRREAILTQQKQAGHSNPDMTWAKIREYAREDAAKKQWWGLSPALIEAQELIASAKAEAKAAKAEAKAEAKTPHAKAVGQIKALVKGIKKEGSGLNTPEITEAAKALCAAFSLDYGTI